jgi:hypothetical protein
MFDEVEEDLKLPFPAVLNSSFARGGAAGLNKEPFSAKRGGFPNEELDTGHSRTSRISLVRKTMHILAGTLAHRLNGIRRSQPK